MTLSLAWHSGMTLPSPPLHTFRNSLSRDFSIELPATLTFDFPSVAALAVFITQELQVRLRLSLPIIPPVGSMEGGGCVSTPVHARESTLHARISCSIYDLGVMLNNI